MSHALPALVSRARRTTILLVACLLVSAARLWHDLTVLGLMSRTGRGSVTMSEARWADDLQTLLAWLGPLAFLACAIAWLMWQHAAVSNLRTMGSRRSQCTPAWSVGWWFVPFVSLVRVPQIVGDTWRRSKAGNVFHDGAGPLPDLVLAWWLTLLLSRVAWRLALALATHRPEGSSLTDLDKLTRYDLMASVLDVACAVMAIAIVQRITRMQLAVTPAPTTA